MPEATKQDHHSQVTISLPLQRIGVKVKTPNLFAYHFWDPICPTLVCIFIWHKAIYCKLQCEGEQKYPTYFQVERGVF
jgi:hypothetical protein